MARARLAYLFALCVAACGGGSGTNDGTADAAAGPPDGGPPDAGCAMVCGPNQECVDGVCACNPPFITCDQDCIDPAGDETNCGGCVANGNGEVCLIGVECISGVCQPCNAPNVVCGDECADLTSNPRHCGACGDACVPGATCAPDPTTGVPTCVCPATAPVACPSGCSDLTDELNCGVCGNECVPGASCTTLPGGNLGCACADPAEVACPGGCALLASDDANCGECGNVCTDGSTCLSGSCVCPALGEVFCGANGCVDVLTDEDNCGACGDPCPIGATCNGGFCECPAGQPDVCGGGRGQCVDLQTNTDFCGNCGNDCVDGLESCTFGSCTCAPTTSDCPGVGGGGTSCTDILSDPNNCGTTCGAADGNQCNDDEYCSGGQCVCRPGFEDCGNGCTSTESDSLNCGGCGTVCMTGALFCQDGACVASCGPGRATCGLDETCVDLDWDPRNCGDCGNNCDRDQVCVFGQCEEYRPTGDCTTCPCDRCGEIFGGDASCCANGTDPICVNASACPL